MRWLVDSNILLRLAHTADPSHQLTKDATAKLHQDQHEMLLVPQNIYEFWVVATRPPNVNGLGFSLARVQSEVVKLKRLFILLDETPSFVLEWEKLVTLHAIVGKNAHDAHLVAAMVVHGVTHLLTFN